MCWRLNLLDHNQKQEWQNTIQEIQTRITKQKTEHAKQQNIKNISNRSRNFLFFYRKIQTRIFTN
jgi:hypothetical protein